MMKRSAGKVIIAILIAITVFFTGCSQEQILELALETTLKVAVNSAVAGDEDATKVVNHMQAKIDMKVLSSETTETGLTALCRVSSPDLTEFVESFDINNYETQEELVNAIIKAIDDAPVTVKEVTVGFQMVEGSYQPTEMEDFLDAYSGGSFGLIQDLMGTDNGVNNNGNGNNNGNNGNHNGNGGNNGNTDNNGNHNGNQNGNGNNGNHNGNGGNNGNNGNKPTEPVEPPTQPPMIDGDDFVDVPFDDVGEGTNGSKGLAYALNADGKTYCVIGIGTCKDTDIIIPGKYMGKPVTKIGKEAFKNVKNLKSVIIPDSVDEIDIFAFFRCHALERVVLPESITYISQGAFRACISLKTITIPKTVSAIGPKAFRDCKGITDVHFGGTVAQWEAITKANSWAMDTGDFIIHCTDGNVMHEDYLIENFSVPNGRIVIKYVEEGKYVTGIPYKYANADGTIEMELALSENKTDALAYRIIKNNDGTFSFKTDCCKFLFCDAVDVKLVSDKSEYTKFIFRFAENGYYIQSATAAYEESPQYLEVWHRGKYLTCYAKDTDREDNYIFAFDFEDAAGAAGTVVES